MRISHLIKNSDYDASYQVYKVATSVQISPQVVYDGQVFSSVVNVPPGYYISDMIVRRSGVGYWLTDNLSLIYQSGENIGDVELYAYLRRSGQSQYSLEIYADVFGGGESNRPLPAMIVEAKMVFSVLPV